MWELRVAVGSKSTCVNPQLAGALHMSPSHRSWFMHGAWADGAWCMRSSSGSGSSEPVLAMPSPEKFPSVPGSDPPRPRPGYLIQAMELAWSKQTLTPGQMHAIQWHTKQRQFEKDFFDALEYKKVQVAQRAHGGTRTAIADFGTSGDLAAPCDKDSHHKKAAAALPRLPTPRGSVALELAHADDVLDDGGEAALMAAIDSQEHQERRGPEAAAAQAAVTAAAARGRSRTPLRRKRRRRRVSPSDL